MPLSRDSTVALVNSLRRSELSLPDIALVAMRPAVRNPVWCAPDLERAQRGCVRVRARGDGESLDTDSGAANAIRGAFYDTDGRSSPTRGPRGTATANRAAVADSPSEAIHTLV